MIKIEIKASKKPRRFRKKVNPLIKEIVEIQKNYPHVGSMEIIIKC
ncbi:hypothetical protein OCV67_12210 [Porcipelethomonas ammoniilytica]|jgi:hypothetical protein|nr:hypothetical protein [Porcipelethomonas ammoniilytica]MCU6720683.1 hypothetical protein [Porcipelethomonas ammoniilytica]SCJ21483.1 Uncharacterised protein [uncultured Ruminococcus sp.]